MPSIGQISYIAWSRLYSTATRAPTSCSPAVALLLLLMRAIAADATAASQVFDEECSKPHHDTHFCSSTSVERGNGRLPTKRGREGPRGKLVP